MRMVPSGAAGLKIPFLEFIQVLEFFKEHNTHNISENFSESVGADQHAGALLPDADGEGDNSLFSQAQTARAASSPRCGRRRWRRPLLPGADGNSGSGLFSDVRAAARAWRGQRCGGGCKKSGAPWNWGFEANFRAGLK
jgi:hypothetical protein